MYLNNCLIEKTEVKQGYQYLNSATVCFHALIYINFVQISECVVVYN